MGGDLPNAIVSISKEIPESLLPMRGHNEMVSIYMSRIELSAETDHAGLDLAHLKNCEEIYFCIRHPVYAVWLWQPGGLRHGKKMILSLTVGEEQRNHGEEGHKHNLGNPILYSIRKMQSLNRIGPETS